MEIRQLFPFAKKIDGEKTAGRKTSILPPAEDQDKIDFVKKYQEIFQKNFPNFRKNEFVSYVNDMISLLGATSTKEGLISNPLSCIGKSKETENISFFKDHKNSNHRIIISTDLRDTTLGTRKRAKKSPPLEKGASPFTLEYQIRKTIPPVIRTIAIPRENTAKLCLKYFTAYMKHQEQ